MTILAKLALFAAVVGLPTLAAAEPSLVRPANRVWDDAASIAANRRAAEAERRTAFQNPGVLDPRRVVDGFEDATRPLVDAGREAGRFVEDGARSLADGTRDVLNGTSRSLEPLAPRSTDAYGDRPTYDSRQASDLRVQPPEPAAADPRFADPRDSSVLRGRTTPAIDDRNYGAAARDDRGFATENRGPALPRNDGFRRDDGFRDSGIAERFTDESDRYPAVDRREAVDRRDSLGRRDFAPIPRVRETSRSEDRVDAFARSEFDRDRDDVFRRRDTRDRDYGFDRRSTAESDFPRMPERTESPAWRSDLARGQSPPPASDNRFANTGFASRPTTPPAGGADADVRSWNGSLGQGAAGGGAADPTNAVQAGVGSMPSNRDAWDMDRFLLVVLTAICCYVVIAHLDLRNRYRAALRGAPTGYSPSA